MGRHASAQRRRSVATWPIVVGVVVLLLVVATVGYFRVIKDDDGQGTACSGTTVLPVVVAPGAAPAIEQAAQAFNATKPEARSTCVSVSVTTVPGPAAVTALADGWRGQRSPAPGLWIADSAGDVAALDAASPAMTAGHPTQGLASSPVVLAARQAPGAPVSWTALASGSAGLVLGIGDPTVDSASAAALQSLVRGASRTPTAPAPVDTAAVATARPMLTRLAGGSAAVPSTTDLALTELAAGKSRYTAVPVVESALATFNLAKGTTLRAVYPTGPTGAEEVMPVPLTASWVTNAMSDAAAAFDAYLGDPAGTAILTAAHLRTAAAPVAAGGLDLRTPVTVLSDAGAPADAALAAAWKAAVAGRTTASTGSSAPTAGVSTAAAAGTGRSTPAAGTPATTATTTTTTTPSPAATRTTTSMASTSKAVAVAPAITFLVDNSGSMRTLDNGAQRLTWVKSAVSTVMQQRPANSFGLWTFATGASASVAVGPPEQLLGGTPRSSVMVDALNRLTPSGNSHTYGAIRAAVTAAATDAVPGSVRRVILLTDGPDSTPGVTRDAVESTVAGLVALHPGLRLDIIGLSGSVNEQALTEIAAAGGGTFTALTTLTDLEPRLLALSS